MFCIPLLVGLLVASDVQTAQSINRLEILREQVRQTPAGNFNQASWDHCTYHQGTKSPLLTKQGLPASGFDKYAVMKFFRIDPVEYSKLFGSGYGDSADETNPLASVARIDAVIAARKRVKR